MVEGRHATLIHGPIPNGRTALVPCAALLYHEQAYRDLLYDPDMVNSSRYECELHYANETSPLLTGDLGVPTFPTLLSATADDVDNADDVYGTGDVIVLQFDMPTNTQIEE